VIDAKASTEDLTMTVGGTPTVEDGTYPANLIALDDKPVPDRDNPEDTMTLRIWKFGLDALDSDGNPAEVEGVSSTALGPRSKAYKWISALLGRKLENGELITREMLLGRECLVTVAQNDNGYSKVIEVVSAPRKKGAPVLDEGPLFPDSPPRTLTKSGVAVTTTIDPVDGLPA